MIRIFDYIKHELGFCLTGGGPHCYYCRKNAIEMAEPVPQPTPVVVKVGDVIPVEFGRERHYVTVLAIEANGARETIIKWTCKGWSGSFSEDVASFKNRMKRGAQYTSLEQVTL